MSKDNKKKGDGSVPDAVLNQIDQHSIGGYALFYFNYQNGMPEHIVSFDSPAFSLAMQKYISDWSKSLDELNIEATKNFIISKLNTGQPPESTEQTDE